MNTRTISLLDIVISHNPRRPVPDLQDNLVNEGVYYVNDDGAAPDNEKVALSPLAFAREYGLSIDPEKRAYFVQLIEKYESGPKGLVELANSRAANALQPINVRSYRVKDGDEYRTRYGIIAGERRTLAAIYNFCKHGNAPKIDAVVRDCTVAEAYDMAIAENAQRKDATDLEYGRIFRGYRTQNNPDTNKNYTLKEVAGKLGMDYQYVRGREALTYLSEADQNRVEHGKLGVTAAIEKGLKLKQGKKDEPVADKKENRQRVLSLAQVQALFDEKYQDLDGNNIDTKYAIRYAYLTALAAVMQIDYEVAEQQAKDRIAAAKKD